MNSALTGVWVIFCVGGKRVCRAVGGFDLPADSLIQVAHGLTNRAREELEEVVADVQNSRDA